MSEVPNYGLRVDGTKKDTGFFGPLKMTDGSDKVMTEYSISVNLDGQDIEMPTLVPTLTKAELAHLLSGGEPTKPIVDKAVAHAKKRLGQGLSPFFDSSKEKLDEATKLYGPAE